MERALGQPLLIENRPGANGALGAAVVAQAAPDGYTWLADSGGFASNLFLMRGLGFDYTTAFALVTQLSILPAVLVVRGGGPLDSLEKLLAELRANPGRASYGSSGVGNLTHLSSAILMRRAGTRAEHVPYRGSPQQMAAMLSGDTLFSFSTLPAAGPLIRDGQLRAIAASSAAPVPGFETVLPLAEQGFPGFDVVEFHQISAPAGTPPAMVERVSDAAAAAMRSPALAGRFQQLGLVPHAEGPAAFASFLAGQRVRLAEVIRAEGIGAE
jgi:tripartite-type tricarboxylate transporter receptor subunit TctC